MFLLLNGNSITQRNNTVGFNRKCLCAVHLEDLLCELSLTDSKPAAWEAINRLYKFFILFLAVIMLRI